VALAGAILALFLPRRETIYTTASIPIVTPGKN
jgi:hypothetical protein